MRPLALVLLVLVAVLAAPPSTASCIGKGPLAACVDKAPLDGHAGASLGLKSADVELAIQSGSGFFGNYVYVLGFAGVEGLVQAHGGAGLVDAGYDGFYENACACGAVQSVVYVPFGIGVEDSDGDGQPDNLYAEPRLV